MRPLHLRHRSNILKRLLIHIGGFNLGLVMRKLFGKGTPRGLRDLLSSLFGQLPCYIEAVTQLWRRLEDPDGSQSGRPRIVRAA